jgi:hypothetical protein
MWVNPRYADQLEQSKAPEEIGRRLATFPRGRDAELHVCLAEFQGSLFVSLRVWERGSDGQLWPVKGKGCSIRMGECGGLAEVLAALAGEHGGRRHRDDGRGVNRRPAQRSLPGPRPPFDPAAGPAREFSEFDE